MDVKRKVGSDKKKIESEKNVERKKMKGKKK